MRHSILVIEDEDKIAELLRMELTHEGYDVDVALSGRAGLEAAMNGNWSLIILDVMLPEMSGLEVLRRLRQGGRSTPVILLTARSSTPDKVSGLDQGANDYLTKPFEIEELLARIRVWIRTGGDPIDSSQPSPGLNKLVLGELSIDMPTREVQRNGDRIELTAKEFDLLVYLMQHRNLVLSRDQIIEQVWGYDFEGDTNIVDVYIRYLRRKIDYPYDTQYIRTYRGVGYSMKETSS